jgi:hypothetical protein
MDLTPIVGVAGVGHMTNAQLPDFINRTHHDPDSGNLLMQMCQVLLATGDDEFALEMQARAIAHRRVYRIAGSISPTLRLLALMGPGTMMDNAPLDFVVDHIAVRLDLLFFTLDEDWPPEVPDHDVLVVAIGESARSEPLLAHVQKLLVGWPRPVLNRPEYIGNCARDCVYAILRNMPGLLVPATRQMQRARLDWQRYPATIRPLDSHAGMGLARIDNTDELQAYLGAHEGDAFQLADYIDYRSGDGLYRKYRIALIDRQPFICHLAIAESWIVHYQTAGMQHSVEKRLEESHQMSAFARGFALRHADALRAIADGLGLDYVVIDCAELIDGNLLLFEADSRGWIHASDPVDLFPYKPGIMQIAFDAFDAMLRRRSRASLTAAK